MDVVILDKHGCAVEQDLRRQNIGLWAAMHLAQNHAYCCQVVVMAVLQKGLAA